MRGGEVVEYGTADAVFETPQHPYTRQLLAAVPRIDSGREQRSADAGLPSPV